MVRYIGYQRQSFLQLLTLPSYCYPNRLNRDKASTIALQAVFIPVILSKQLKNLVFEGDARSPNHTLIEQYIESHDILSKRFVVWFDNIDHHHWSAWVCVNPWAVLQETTASSKFQSGYLNFDSKDETSNGLKNHIYEAMPLVWLLNYAVFQRDRKKSKDIPCFIVENDRELLFQLGKQGPFGTVCSNEKLCDNKYPQENYTESNFALKRLVTIPHIRLVQYDGVNCGCAAILSTIGLVYSTCTKPWLKENFVAVEKAFLIPAIYNLNVNWLGGSEFVNQLALLSDDKPAA